MSRSPSRGFGRFRSPGATLANPCKVFKSLSYLRSSLAKIQLFWAHPAVERRRIPRLRAHGVLTSVSGTRGQGTGTALETSPVRPGSAREARKGVSGCKKRAPGKVREHAKQIKIDAESLPGTKKLKFFHAARSSLIVGAIFRRI